MDSPADVSTTGIRIIPFNNVQFLIPFSTYLCTMQFSSGLLENAVNEFAKLPGIGKNGIAAGFTPVETGTGKVNAFGETIMRMRRELNSASVVIMLRILIHNTICMMRRRN